MSVESKEYRPGERIGGEYEVLKVFGGENRSGMGVVYLVKNREAPWPMVLKTFQRVASQDAKRQFVSEAQAWIRAGAHIHIVQAHWVREIDGQLFVAAEYIEPDGEGRNNLNHFLGAGQLRVEIALLWAVQFCRGMDYARSKGVLAHRDIKPDNLMIDGNATLKITDFGLAKSVDANATPRKHGWWPFGKNQPPQSISKTKTGAAIGTLPYMAPEQFVDAKSADHRADIYSFGIVLYQMVSGNQYPYQIKSDTPDVESQFFRAHVMQAPLSVDSPLMPVISRCMEKRPDRRYATYEAFLNDLDVVAGKLRVKLPPLVHVAREDEELFAQAQSYVALGDKDRALRAVDEYVAKYPENFCGWTQKGVIHLERGESRKSAEATRRSLGLNPYSARAWNNLGLALARLGRVPEAIDGSTSPDLEHVRDAINSYAAALENDPLNTGAMMNAAASHVVSGNFEDAGRLLTRALELAPQKKTLLFNVGNLAAMITKRGAIGPARQLFVRLAQVDPKNILAWHNLGMIALVAGRQAEAIDCFKRVVELDGGDVTALRNLASLYGTAGQTGKAIECCDRLLEVGAEFVAAVSMKAQLLAHLGKGAEAKRILEDATRKQPGADALWFILSLVSEQSGELGRALEAARECHRLLKAQGAQVNPQNLADVEKRLQGLIGRR